MTDFFKWLVLYSPPWAAPLFSLVATITLGVALILSIWFLVEGWWVIPLFMWIVLPSFVIVRAYFEDTKDD